MLQVQHIHAHLWVDTHILISAPLGEHAYTREACICMNIQTHMVVAKREGSGLGGGWCCEAVPETLYFSGPLFSSFVKRG